MDSTHVLTTNDARVLAALFDPETSLDASAGLASLSHTTTSPNLKIDVSVLEQEKEAIHLLNTFEPQVDAIQNALSKLDWVCEQAPGYASGWCNRAQATRLYLSKISYRENEPEAQHFLRMAKEDPKMIQQLFSDLSRAISLASGTSASAKSTIGSTEITDRASSLDARVLAAAHTHRGYLILLSSRSNEDFNADILPLPLRGLNMQSLEETANREFALGARYGNQIAKQVSIKTNPYAKLCGGIVKEAMRKELMEHVNDTPSKQ